MQDPDGLGYRIQNMNGDWTESISYERRETEEGFYVTYMDGTESKLIPWPKEVDEDFNSEEVSKESEREAARAREAELAAK